MISLTALITGATNFLPQEYNLATGSFTFARIRNLLAMVSKVSIKFLQFVFLFSTVVNLEQMHGTHGTAANSTCNYLHGLRKPLVETGDCRPALSGMVQCLTFLLEQVLKPTNSCCAAAAKTWKAYPACLCKITFYPPGHLTKNTAETGIKFSLLCNLTSELCDQCPTLLGMLTGLALTLLFLCDPTR